MRFFWHQNISEKSYFFLAANGMNGNSEGPRVYRKEHTPQKMAKNSAYRVEQSGIMTIEPSHEKTNNLHIRKQTQISCAVPA